MGFFFFFFANLMGKNHILLLFIWLHWANCGILVPNSIVKANAAPTDILIYTFLSTSEVELQFSCSVVSDSLQPRGLRHARPPCPSPAPGIHPNPRPLSRWCHPTISSSVVPFSSCPQSLPALVFSNESALCMRWPKYCSFSFSISPSNEHPGLISFRMDWLGLLASTY